MTRAVVLLLAVALSGTSACLDRIGGRRLLDATVPGDARPDEPPVLLNDEPPFRYPPALWAQRLQGNVTLRIHVGPDGIPVADSTRIAEGSGIAALDTAALLGVRELRFRPARLRDTPIGVTLMLPVFFRHPDAPPLPGDSGLAPIRRNPPSAE